MPAEEISSKKSFTIASLEGFNSDNDLRQFHDPILKDIHSTQAIRADEMPIYLGLRTLQGFDSELI